MDISGKWKIKELLSSDESSPDGVWKTKDQLTDEEELQSINIIMDFKNDGTIEMLLPIPDGVSLEELKKEKIPIRGNMCLIEKRKWKNDKGINKYDSGISGDILGTEIDPWKEISENGDMIEMEVYRLIRAD